MEPEKKEVNVGLSIIKIEAYLITLVNMQAQIISKIENRDKDEIFKNAMNDVSKNIKELFEGINKS